MKYFSIVFLVLIVPKIYAQQVSQARFDMLAIKEKANIDQLINSKDSWSLYKLSPILESYNRMYLATNDKTYLANALSIINRVIDDATPSSSLRSSQFRDRYSGWVNKSHEQKGDDGKEYPLFESYLWRYVTYTLVLIKKNGLYNSFQDDYNRILSFTESNIFSKWKARGTSNIYRENTNMFALWAHTCLNLWILTGKQSYLQVCKDFKKQFSANLVINNSNNTLFWNSFFNKRQWNNKGQDVSHSNAEASFIIDAYDNGLYDYSIIKQLINTLNLVIIHEDGTTAMYLDGSGDGKGRIVDGFMRLGRFDRTLQNKLKGMKFYQPSEYHKEILYISTLLANDTLLKKR